MGLRLGIIGRCDSRGIAYQSIEAIRGLHPERVLGVMLNDRRWPEEPGRLVAGLPRHKVMYVNSDLATRSLDMDKIRRFLSGLDAVFAIETVYDWRLIDLADQLGVKVTIQGNPEFYTHHTDPDRPQPHQWIWPTSWMADSDVLPDGPVIPVPFPTPPDGVRAADPAAGPLRVLHVAGHRAIGDRNGTDLVCEAIPLLGPNVHVTIVGQDGALPMPLRLPRGVTADVNMNGVEERWDLYRDQHILIAPRRYGGLSLPTIEATACGVVAMMPDAPENRMWPILPLPTRPGRLQRVPYGRVPTHAVKPQTIAAKIDSINRDRTKLAVAQAAAWNHAQAFSWVTLRSRYLEVLAP